MSRVTPIPPPVKKSFQQFIRSISSSAKTGHPSPLLDSRARINAYLPRGVKDLKTECTKRQLKSTGNKSELVERLAAHDLVSAHGYHTIGSGARPVVSAASVSHRVIPLMQGFHSSAPKYTAHDNSTIDYAFLPSLSEQVTDFFASVRVPLLPDNYSVDRSATSAHAHETLDIASTGSDVNVVAAKPDQVSAASLEVVGNDGLDVDIGQLQPTSASSQESEQGQIGVFVELWRSLLEDVFGPQAVRRV